MLKPIAKQVKIAEKSLNCRETINHIVCNHEKWYNLRNKSKHTNFSLQIFISRHVSCLLLQNLFYFCSIEWQKKSKKEHLLKHHDGFRSPLFKNEQTFDESRKRKTNFYSLVDNEIPNVFAQLCQNYCILIMSK